MDKCIVQKPLAVGETPLPIGKEGMLTAEDSGAQVVNRNLWAKQPPNGPQAALGPTGGLLRRQQRHRHRCGPKQC